MTNRSRALVVLGVLGAVLGTLRDQEMLATLSLAVLFWIFGTWALFSIRISLLWPTLSLSRTFNGHPSNQVTLWSDRTVEIGTRISSSSGSLPALCTLDDLLPEWLSLSTGKRTLAVVRPTDVVELHYECRVLAAGRFQLPGVHLQFRDPQGLFVTERFLEQPVSVRSLPSFSHVGDSRSSVKRINSLPQHGIHRLQRAGLGSELLDLREYQPGDPPKSIAWKVSARRDRLMTRQYEAEVPVRITLFIDGSEVNRLGGFGLRQLDQMNFLAGSVARSAISAGDALGCVLLGTREPLRLSPAFGERAFYRVLDALSKFSSVRPNVSTKLTSSSLSMAVQFARRRYPELLRPAINRIPFSWLPLTPKRRQKWRERVQLAGVLGIHGNLSPAEVCQLYWDDEQLATLAQQFLWDHGWACMSPHSQQAGMGAGELLEESLMDADLMYEALTKTVALARDNEVFVIVANLFNRSRYVSRVLPAIKTAVARHHRVVVLCTRPRPTVPRWKVRASTESELMAVRQEHDVLVKAQAIEIDNHLLGIKRQLSQAGTRVAVASERNAVSLVLAEAELAGRGLSVARGTV